MVAELGKRWFGPNHQAEVSQTITQRLVHTSFDQYDGLATITEMKRVLSGPAGTTLSHSLYLSFINEHPNYQTGSRTFDPESFRQQMIAQLDLPSSPNLPNQPHPTSTGLGQNK